MSLSDAELLRYARQILLPDMDIAGQEKIKNAQVLIIGMGGIGCPLAQYLAAAGVGKLIIVDPDHIEASNLQRQILFTQADLGRLKVDVAAERLRQQNPFIHIEAVAQFFNDDNADGLLDNADIVIDGCDNFATRDKVNQYCVKHKKPLVSAAAIGYDFQLALFDVNDKLCPCYRCLYPDSEDAAQRCHDSGVLAPVVGMVGSFAAITVLQKIVLGTSPQQGKLSVFSSHTMAMKTLTLTKDLYCDVCSSLKNITEEK